MNTKLALALILAFVLAACNGSTGSPQAGTVPAVTAEPTAVIPTEVPLTVVPSPTATSVPTVAPTATPTDIPTPTVTPGPTVWEVAEQMMAECAGGHLAKGPEFLGFDYVVQLGTAIYQARPELQEDLDSERLIGGLMSQVLLNDGRNPQPFPVDPSKTTSSDWWINSFFCEGYELNYENTPENNDGDRILVGEAWLFYETGGTQPLVMDGELKEIHFFFPPTP